MLLEGSIAMPVFTYSCINCGDSVYFDIEAQMFACKSCRSRFTLEQMDKAFPDDEAGSVWKRVQSQSMMAEEAAKSEDAQNSDERIQCESGGDFGEEVTGYSCPRCGAHIITDRQTASTFCAFCRNPVTIPDRLVAGAEAPKRLIPFKIPKEAVKEIFVKHCRKKPLLPKVFLSSTHIDEFRSVYVPFWLFDSLCDGSVTAECTRVTTWSDSSYNYVKTDIYEARRAGGIRFSKMPVDGSERIDDEQMQKIEPFDHAGMTDFSIKFLTGHFAERPDRPLSKLFGDFKLRAKPVMEETFLRTISGYSSVSLRYSTSSFHDTSSEYVMFPVWMLLTRFKEKDYLFAINGQTGKLAGNLPVSVGRLFRWIAAISLPIALLYFIVREVILWLS
jgi:DNA-directed RNA polymerase subunit RPC12/RpoP